MQSEHPTPPTSASLSSKTAELTNTPSENGPGLKSFLNTNLDTMGTMYATYNAATEIANTELVAAEPNSASNPTSSANAQSNQTVLTGVPVYVFILYSRSESGSAPSLANANDCREAARSMEEPIMYLKAIWGH